MRRRILNSEFGPASTNNVSHNNAIFHIRSHHDKELARLSRGAKETVHSQIPRQTFPGVNQAQGWGNMPPHGFPAPSTAASMVGRRTRREVRSEIVPYRQSMALVPAKPQPRVLSSDTNSRVKFHIMEERSGERPTKIISTLANGVSLSRPEGVVRFTRKPFHTPTIREIRSNEDICQLSSDQGMTARLSTEDRVNPWSEALWGPSISSRDGPTNDRENRSNRGVRNKSSHRISTSRNHGTQTSSLQKRSERPKHHKSEQKDEAERCPPELFQNTVLIPAYEPIKVGRAEQSRSIGPGQVQALPANWGTHHSGEAENGSSDHTYSTGHPSYNKSSSSKKSETSKRQKSESEEDQENYPSGFCQNTTLASPRKHLNTRTDEIWDAPEPQKYKASPPGRNTQPSRETEERISHRSHSPRHRSFKKPPTKRSSERSTRRKPRYEKEPGTGLVHYSSKSILPPPRKTPSPQDTDTSSNSDGKSDTYMSHGNEYGFNHYGSSYHRTKGRPAEREKRARNVSFLKPSRESVLPIVPNNTFPTYATNNNYCPPFSPVYPCSPCLPCPPGPTQRCVTCVMTPCSTCRVPVCSVCHATPCSVCSAPVCAVCNASSYGTHGCTACAACILTCRNVPHNPTLPSCSAAPPQCPPSNVLPPAPCEPLPPCYNTVSPCSPYIDWAARSQLPAMIPNFVQEPASCGSCEPATGGDAGQSATTCRPNKFLELIRNRPAMANSTCPSYCRFQPQAAAATDFSGIPYTGSLVPAYSVPRAANCNANHAPLHRSCRPPDDEGCGQTLLNVFFMIVPVIIFYVLLFLGLTRLIAINKFTRLAAVLANTAMLYIIMLEPDDLIIYATDKPRIQQAPHPRHPPPRICCAPCDRPPSSGTRSAF